MTLTALQSNDTEARTAFGMDLSLWRRYHEATGDSVGVPEWAKEVLSAKDSDALMHWAAEIRGRFDRGELSEEEELLLEAAGFEIDLVSWDINFAYWKYVKLKHGSPLFWKNEARAILGEKLGPRVVHWMSHQRSLANNNGMPPRHLYLLDEAGFVFDRNEFRWKTNLEKLRTYQDEHGFGSSPSAQSADKELRKLGWFLAKARQKFDNDELPVDRIEDLADLGLILTYDVALVELRSYQGENGWGSAPKASDPEPKLKNLGYFLAKLRRQHQDGRLEAAQARELMELGVLNRDFDKVVDDARDYQAENSGALPNANDPDPRLRSLGLDLARLRRLHRTKSRDLTAEQAEVLKELGVISR